MSEKRDARSVRRWAELRFAVVGPLLSAPPPSPDPTCPALPGAPRAFCGSKGVGRRSGAIRPKRTDTVREPGLHCLAPSRAFARKKLCRGGEPSASGAEPSDILA